STEIMEFLQAHARNRGGIVARWCANEKTAYEGAMGVSYAGRRALVTMKHVGLNVAFDAFVNSALQKINGGLVAAVADDPGMHSSQNEQDTRYLADFAKTVCFEPRNHQEAYDMTREAFDLSERCNIPVVVRLVTRLAHSRSIVQTREGRPQNALNRAGVIRDWMCIPSCARPNYHALLQCQPRLLEYSERSAWNMLETNEQFREYGVVTAGLGSNYYREVAPALPAQPPHLHIGTYPIPVGKLRRLAGLVERIVVIEEGYPFVEEKLRSAVRDPIPIRGKMDGFLPGEGELSPDIVGHALGLPSRRGIGIVIEHLPSRPPQLCKGCPHHDTFAALRAIVDEFPGTIVTSDIGCYTLGAIPPYEIIHSASCMGASIGMARGAAEAGHHPVIATIGDSTFIHSGITGLVDAVTSNVNMVLLILDNGTTAMTGGQDTVMDSGRIVSLISGAGVAPEHLHTMIPLPGNYEKNVTLLRQELNYEGFSVIIARRECIRKLKKSSKGAAVS
ncbi:MAG: hypothetical protein JXA18_01965, partial [Chitinispirillaceae bacterium]|nr:hypothetical protein [Chitinispirillaceae bacterium]